MHQRRGKSHDLEHLHRANSLCPPQLRDLLTHDFINQITSFRCNLERFFCSFGSAILQIYAPFLLIIPLSFYLSLCLPIKYKMLALGEKLDYVMQLSNILVAVDNHQHQARSSIGKGDTSSEQEEKKNERKKQNTG